MPLKRVEPQELEGHQQPAQHRDDHEDQRGHEIPEDQPLVDQVPVAGQFLFQGRFLTLFQIHESKESLDRLRAARRSSPGSVQAAGSVSRW